MKIKKLTDIVKELETNSGKDPEIKQIIADTKLLCNSSPGQDLLLDVAVNEGKEENLVPSKSQHTNTQADLAASIDRFLTRTNGFFKQHSYAQSRKQVTTIKKQILKNNVAAKNAYQEKLDEEFLVTLIENLKQQLSRYIKGPHWKAIAKDRRDIANSLIFKLDEIKTKTDISSTKKIAEIFKELVAADAQIKKDDITHSPRNVCSNSRLQEIVAINAQSISHNDSREIQQATWEARSEYHHVEDKKFQEKLIANLLQEVKTYRDNFHLKSIASDRKSDLSDLLHSIENIGKTDIPSQIINKVLIALNMTKNNIELHDRNHFTRNVLSKSRLLIIVEKYIGLISAESSPFIRSATAKTREQIAVIPFFANLKKDLENYNKGTHNTQRHEQAEQTLDLLKNIDKSSDKTEVETRMLGNLHGTKIEMVIGDQTANFFHRSEGGKLRNIVEKAITDILERAKTNNALAVAIKERLRTAIVDMKSKLNEAQQVFAELDKKNISPSKIKQAQVNLLKLKNSFSAMKQQYQEIINLPIQEINFTAPGFTQH